MMKMGGRKMGRSMAKMKHGQGCVVWYVAGGMLEMAESTISLPQQMQSSEKLDAKFKRMGEIIGDSGFNLIGESLRILFYNPICISGKDNPHRTAHGLAVAWFLQGKTNVKMSKIIELIYSHKHSAPLSGLTHYHTVKITICKHGSVSRNSIVCLL